MVKTCGALIFLLTLPAASVGAQDMQSMKLSHELGSVLASEDACGLAYDKGAIERFVESRVKAADMTFITMLELSLIHI